MHLAEKLKMWSTYFLPSLFRYIGLQLRIRRSKREAPSPHLLEQLVMPYCRAFKRETGHELRAYYKILNRHRIFLHHINRVLRESKRNIPKEFGIFLYCAVRYLQPINVIETGVASGVSTSFILQALNDNQKGRLFSFDVPDFTLLRLGRAPGWAVPSWLRSRWTLILKPSTRGLLPLCKNLGHVELFLHDSEHTTPIQLFEYQTVYQYLSPGAWLISDDIGDSPAFLKFAKKCGIDPYVLQFKAGTYVGVLVKK